MILKTTITCAFIALNAFISNDNKSILTILAVDFVWVGRLESDIFDTLNYFCIFKL